MTALRTRLLTLFALAFVVVAAAQLSGARPAEARTKLPPVPFTEIPAGLTGAYYGGSAWGDYNSDGKLDVVVTGYSGTAAISKLYRNNGDGSFTEIPAGLTGAYYSSVAWGDYNSDGRPDIALTGYSGTASFSKIYRNNGDGSFTEIPAGLTGVLFGSIAWGDYNSDGKPDILLAGHNGTVPTALLYRNNGDGSFTEIPAGLTGVIYGSVAWGDYSSDGKPDILLTGNTGTATTSKLYRNNGDGSFTEIPAGLTGVYFGQAAWGDYNSDGKPDIALTGYSGTAAVSKLYRNNGDGSFTEIPAGLIPLYYGSVAWGDYNSDGKPDLLLAGHTGTTPTTLLYRNNGDGTFTDAGTGLTAAYNGSVAWGDYNSDGKLDILLQGVTTTTPVLKIFRNTTTDTNAVPKAPKPLAAQLAANGDVTFVWNAATDSKTPAAALSYNLRVSKTAGGSDVVSPLANSTGVRFVAGIGNAGERTSFTLHGLAAGTYFWSAQAIDSSLAGSPFGKEQKFSIPPKISIKLKPRSIKTCGKKGRSTTVSGLIAAAPSPAVAVTLEKRVGSHGAWKTLKTVNASSFGSFSFSKVGKGAKRSFSLRVAVTLSGGTTITSQAKRVKVKGPASCKKK
ncbi:MAG: FG-GAP repeat domain-containing protein [Gaiellaceae bacterium]